MQTTRKQFESFVEDAIAALPEHLRGSLDNVGFVIEDRARSAKKHEVGLMVGDELLGLYEGVPHDERGSEYFGALPDKITIFREPIMEEAEDEEDLANLVREVVWHEIGHHFGFDDDELHIIEEKRGQRYLHHGEEYIVE